MRLHMLEMRAAALRRLDQLARASRSNWGSLRARRRLAEMRAALQLLARTAHLVPDADLPPDHAALRAFFGPVIHELERCQSRPRSERRRDRTARPTKE